MCFEGTNHSRCSENLLFDSMKSLDIIFLSEKITVPGFFPVLETLSLSEKIPVPGFFPVLER